MEGEVVLFGDNRTELLRMYLMGREGKGGEGTEEWRPTITYLSLITYLLTYPRNVVDLI